MSDARPPACLVVGATGNVGRSVYEALSEKWTTYGMQRRCHDSANAEKWIDADLLTPENTVVAVERLYTDQGNPMEPWLQAVVFTNGWDKTDQVSTMTSFDLANAARVNVFEPMMLVNYLVQFDVLKPGALVAFLEDPRQPDPERTAHWITKKGMSEMVRAFATVMPRNISWTFLATPPMWQLNAGRDTGRRIVGLVEQSMTDQPVPERTEV